jgi:hypothetical protein
MSFSVPLGMTVEELQRAMNPQPPVEPEKPAPEKPIRKISKPPAESES